MSNTISFETAKLLKEKGFDCEKESITAMYREDGKFYSLSSSDPYYYDYDDFDEYDYIAPTLHMTIKWLKEEHNLGVIPYWSQVSGEFGCRIYDLTKRGKQEYHSISGSFDGFEGPAELGIKYCLENLIQL